MNQESRKLGSCSHTAVRRFHMFGVFLKDFSWLAGLKAWPLLRLCCSLIRSSFLIFTSLRHPPSDPASVRFVFIAESSPQSWLLVQHNEQMRYEKEHARIDEERQRFVIQCCADQGHSGADIHRVTHETIRPADHE